MRPARPIIHPKPAISSAVEEPAATASPNLARSAGLIGFGTMTSRVLGLVRDQVLAYFFGAGTAMDAFNVAFRLPNLLRDLFAEGAMSASFVPAFTRRLVLGGKEAAWALGRQVITALVLATAGLALLGIVFSEQLVMLVASGFAEVPGKLELTILLTRVMFPFLVLVAVAAACMGMLNSLHRFFVPALSPAMFNVATILSVLILMPAMPAFGLPPVMAVATGTLIGGLGQIAIQWPLLRREGFRYRPALDRRDEELRQVVMLMGPGVLGLAAVQANIFVNTIIATGQGEGAVSWLNYAFRLMYMPIGLFGVSVATAALPAIARHAAREDLGALRETLSSGLRMMLMLSVPATVGLIVLATPIVELIFERGEFSTADTAATAAALAFYAPGLVGYSAVKIMVPVFYALREARTAVIVSAATVALNIVLNLTLVGILGFRGLALGTAIAAAFNGGVLLLLLRSRLGEIDGRRLAVSACKIVVATAAMGAVTVAMNRWMAMAVPGEGVFVLAVRLGATILVALLVLGISARAVRIPEFAGAMSALSSRFTTSRRRS
jgi:putative peptidoglycan lipid II flippase